MLITHNREKLINTILYFSENTDYCGKIKLFKLLYFLDFEHYKITGRSITGMNYFAWKMGPVPVELYEEIESPEPDMAAIVQFESIPTKFKQPMLRIVAKKSFDKTHFTKREISLMEQLATEYRTTKAEEMIEATHLENMPWDKIYNQQGKHREIIPYELAFRSQEADMMAHIAQTHKDVVAALT